MTENVVTVPSVGDLDLVGLGRLDDAQRAVAARRHVDLRALRALVPDDPRLRELLAEVDAQRRRLAGSCTPPPCGAT